VWKRRRGDETREEMEVREREEVYKLGISGSEGEERGLEARN